MEARIARQETIYVNGGSLGVYVDHGNGVVSHYLHLSEIFVHFNVYCYVDIYNRNRFYS